MTQEEQRIAIAEACGWTEIRTHREENLQLEWLVGLPPNPHVELAVPDYLRDLDAMHEAEATLSEHDQARYQDVLAFMFVGPSETYPLFHVIHATGAQRAEAFLRTIGLWK